MDFVNIENICSNGYYAVPDYQRDYEWTAYQNEALKDDIFAIADSPNTQNHFMGALVTVKYDLSNAVNQSKIYKAMTLIMIMCVTLLMVSRG